MKRKSLVIALCLSIVMAALPFRSLVCSAADTNHAIKVTIDGNPIHFDQPPMMIGNRVMVPLRAIFEALGYKLTWDDGTQTATAVKENNTITVQQGNKVIKYSGGTYNCDVAPANISGRILVPVRAVAECSGYDVNWDPDTYSVIIGAANGQSESSSAPLHIYQKTDGALDNFDYYYDLDFDGVKDHIKLEKTIIKGEYESAIALNIIINDTATALVEEGTDGLADFTDVYITDIDSTDKAMEIVIYNGDAGGALWIYRYEQGQLTEMNADFGWVGGTDFNFYSKGDKTFSFTYKDYSGKDVKKSYSETFRGVFSIIK